MVQRLLALQDETETETSDAKSETSETETQTGMDTETSDADESSGGESGGEMENKKSPARPKEPPPPKGGPAEAGPMVPPFRLSLAALDVDDEVWAEVSGTVGLFRISSVKPLRGVAVNGDGESYPLRRSLIALHRCPLCYRPAIMRTLQCSYCKRWTHMECAGGDGGAAREWRGPCCPVSDVE